MHREILRVLLDKPDLYLRAWSWIYSRIEDNFTVQFSYEDMDLMGKVKVSDSTFKKILHTQNEWNSKKIYTKIEAKEGTYTVHFYDPPIELTEEEKSKALSKVDDKKTIRRKLTDEQIRLRKKCLAMYVSFYECRFGIPPPINGLQMKSLDDMVKYFKSTGKADTEDRIMLAFEIIYKYWDIYPKAINTKYMLNQIFYNLPNILACIRSQHSKSKVGKVEEVGKKMNEAINSGALDKQIENLGKR